MAARGKWVPIIVILALAGFGAWKWRDRAFRPTTAPGLVEADSPASAPAPTPTQPTPQAIGDLPNQAAAAAMSAFLAETASKVPRLPPAGAYQPKDNIVEIEISEYAGYAGLIVANGGLEPNENSEFFKKGGFKVKFIRNEVESRGGLNAGKIAALATTVDVLPIYGRQFQVVVPVQIDFSRGADGVVVRREIKRINDLKGRVLAAAQFTESDYFIRFLAREAGLGIHMLAGLKDRPDPNKVNLVYCQDAFSAGDLFLKDIRDGANLLAGCVTWAPKTTEVATQSQGRANVLITSRNLLIIADILVVNQGFARQHPAKVAALVAGLLEGNRQVRDHQEACLDVIAKAFGWDREKTKAELAKVHLANLPENQAFFSGLIDSAGSFDLIYQSAVLAYGKNLIKDPVDGRQFLDLKHLTEADRSGAFKDQAVAIAPIHVDDAISSEDPLLSKDIRFLFKPNTFTLQIDIKENLDNLDAIRQMLQVGPGSTMLLRGHVDNAMVAEFRKQGGEDFVKQVAVKALELSKLRALEIRRLLVERYQIEPGRIKTVGRGWEEPAGTTHDQNRRVEAQWFTAE